MFWMKICGFGAFLSAAGIPLAAEIPIPVLDNKTPAIVCLTIVCLFFVFAGFRALMAMANNLGDLNGKLGDLTAQTAVTNALQRESITRQDELCGKMSSIERIVDRVSERIK